MKEGDIKEVGIYILWWSEIPTDLSVAAVGCDRSGKIWFHPTNWVSGPVTDWSIVHRAELITTQEIEIQQARINQMKGKV